MTASLLSELNAKVKARYWKRVDVAGPADCWEWQGASTPKGYGKLRVGYALHYTHRIALALDGREPAGLIARHKCDNPRCCNPAHLILGSVADNSADMMGRGRSMRGEKNHFSKLRWIQVRAIRESSGSNVSIARKFGVAESTIRAILSYKTWRPTVQVNRGAMVVLPEGDG